MRPRNTILRRVSTWRAPTPTRIPPALMRWTLAAAIICIALATPTAATASTRPAIAAGNYDTCGLTSSGTVKCWGYNGYGQLGDGTTTDKTTPVEVSGLTGAIAIAAGAYHTCALTSAGTVKCWGDNESGQLGNGTTTNSTTPVEVSGLTGAIAITAGVGHTCALTSAGRVECWGWNFYGQLGNGTSSGPEHCNQGFACSTTPVEVSGLTGAIAINSGGGFHTCALTSAGTVQCWGYNNAGQLGDGSSTGPEMCGYGSSPCSTTPVEVSGLTGAIASTAGAWHTCAVTSAGTVTCWGNNFLGQLGNGTLTLSTTPVEVSGLTGAIAITAGEDHTCGLTSAGTVQCWGWNRYGQLGNGSSTGPETCSYGESCSSVPVAVVGLSGGVAAISADGGRHTCALTSAGRVECWGQNLYGQLGDGTTTDKTSPVDVIGLVRATCTTNTGTITLAPGLTGTAVYQGVTIEGTLTGCSGEPFTEAKYTATLTTTSKVTCSALSGPGAATFGTVKYVWTPKTKATYGTLSLPLTETAGIALSGELESGPYSPLMLSGTASESYTNAAICGKGRVVKAVTKGTFTGSSVSFE